MYKALYTFLCVCVCVFLCPRTSAYRHIKLLCSNAFWLLPLTPCLQWFSSFTRILASFWGSSFCRFYGIFLRSYKVMHLHSGPILPWQFKRTRLSKPWTKQEVGWAENCVLLIQQDSYRKHKEVLLLITMPTSAESWRELQGRKLLRSLRVLIFFFLRVFLLGKWSILYRILWGCFCPSL